MTRLFPLIIRRNIDLALTTTSRLGFLMGNEWHVALSDKAMPLASAVDVLEDKF